MDQKTSAQLLEKVPYFNIEFGGCIPSTEQLEAKIEQLTKQIFVAQIVAILFSVGLAFLAYMNAWTDLGADVPYLVFNRWCLLPLGIGLLILGFAKLHTDRVRTIRSAFMPSSSKLVSFDPTVQRYIDAVIANGRKYLTNYETFKLFPHREAE